MYERDYTPIPEVLRLRAMALGLHETAIARRWGKYLQWWKRTGKTDHDVRDWERQVRWALEDERVPALKPLTPDEQDRAARREAERAEREAQDSAYKASAVSLRQWLEQFASADEKQKALTMATWMHNGPWVEQKEPEYLAVDWSGKSKQGR